MQIATRSKAQKYMRRSFIIVSTFLIIAAFFFQGHIFISSYGYMIVLNSDGCHRAIVNGSSVAIEFGNTNVPTYYSMNSYGTEGIFPQDREEKLMMVDSGTTLCLTSGRLGELKLPIAQDLMQGKNRIEQSANLDAVDASKYSKKQINLLYQYFDYYLDENGFLLLPNYSRKTSVSLFQLMISLALMIWLGIRCESDNYEVTYWEKYNLKQNIRVAVGILLALIVSISPLLTIW